MRGFANWAYIHQRTRQESPNSIDVDGKTAFDLAIDNADYYGVGFVCCFEVFPGFGTLGLFARQFGFTKTVFHGLQGYLYFITDAEATIAVGIKELVTRDHTFGFQARMYSDPLIIDINNNPGDNRTGLHIDGF